MKSISTIVGKEGQTMKRVLARGWRIICALCLFYSSLAVVFTTVAVFPGFLDLITPFITNPPMAEGFWDRLMYPILFPLAKFIPAWFLFFGMFVAWWIVWRGVRLLRESE